MKNSIKTILGITLLSMFGLPVYAVTMNVDDGGTTTVIKKHHYDHGSRYDHDSRYNHYKDRDMRKCVRVKRCNENGCIIKKRCNYY